MPKVLCQLCDEVIHRKDWYQANHREVCALRYSDWLKTFPILKDKDCPICHGNLKLWPQRGPAIFLCDETLQSVTNDGRNRFCCFRCDYNICIQNWNPERLRFYHDNDEEKPEESEFLNPKKNVNENHEEFESPPSYEEVIRLKRKDTF